MIEFVCSGFQTGVDFFGVKAAHDLGIRTCGWMPKGWKTEDGAKPEYQKQFGAWEHKSPSYEYRTEDNVKLADATLIYSRNIKSAGTRCTLEYIRQHDKLFLDIITVKSSCRETARWIFNQKVKSVNIAGNRESVCPGIGIETYVYFTKVFAYLLGLYDGRSTALNELSQ